MAEDTIIVDIDDSALENLMIRLELLGVTSQEITGSRDLGKALPSIDRNLRLILGRVPGMRQAIQAYFRLSWLETGMLKSPLRLKMGLEPLAAGMSYGPLILIVMATALILLETIQRYFKDMQQRQTDYENFLMRERGWTRTELADNYARIHNYTRSFPG